MESKEGSSINKLNRVRAIIGVLIIVIIGLTGLVLYQQQKISESNQKITGLNKKQLPTNLYKSYDDCISNGGIMLDTINAQFNGCLGGDKDESGQLPQHQAFLQYSAQNLPRIMARNESTIGSKVTAKNTISRDLVEFLAKDGSCAPSKGEFEVIKEVTNRFALMKYGCEGGGQVQSNSSPTIIGMKLADGWVLISPTNNMDDEGRPSCLLVDMFKISKELSPKCFENTGFNNGELKEVVHL